MIPKSFTRINENNLRRIISLENIEVEKRNSNRSNFKKPSGRYKYARLGEELPKKIYNY